MYFVCIERSAYWLFWIATTCYALYQFALANQNQTHLYQFSSQEFRNGFLNDNPYDANDFEWQSFKKLYTDYWYIVLIHFALSNVLTLAKQPALKLTAWILITLYATYTVFSVGALVVVIINVIMLILLAILGKNILSYALCFGVVLASQSTEIANRIFNSNDPRMTNEFDFEEKRFLFTYCICFLNARGLSSSLDNLTVGQKKKLGSGKEQFYEKVITIAAYLLYLPGFFAGPLYLYTDFEKATKLVKKEPEKEMFLGSNYYRSMMRLFILIANIIYYEWLLHWLYSSAVSQEVQVVAAYNSWQLSGFVVSLCLLFYLKYTCIFGTFRVLATFDGVASVAPPLPQCPASMHLGSQLWRNFDVGIYRWLRSYIYDPFMRQQPKSTLRRFVAIFLCFVCIAIWHLPLTPALITWLCLNIVGALNECWAKSISQTEFWSSSVKGSLSRGTYLRLLAFISLPLTILTIISNLFFLTSNEDTAHEFVSRMLNNTDNYGVYLILALYCLANVSLDYNRVVKSDVDLARCHGFPSCRDGGSQLKQTNVKSKSSQSKKSN